MACIPLDPPTLPALPDPFSITPPALPPVGLDAAVCCKLLAFAIPAIPIPLPPGTLSVAGVNAAINSMNAAVRVYLDALPLSCPKELQQAVPA